MGNVVKMLKKTSAFSSFTAVVGLPGLLMLFDTKIPLAGQLTAVSLALCTTLAATGILHYALKGYVLKMWALPPSSSPAPAEQDDGVAAGGEAGEGEQPRQMMAATFVNILGFEKRKEFDLYKVDPRPDSTRPFTNFYVDGTFPAYVAPQIFTDRTLLGKLIGSTRATAELSKAKAGQKKKQK